MKARKNDRFANLPEHQRYIERSIASGYNPNHLAEGRYRYVLATIKDCKEGRPWDHIAALYAAQLGHLALNYDISRFTEKK